MRPVLFSVAGLDVTGYGVSKALAVIVAGWLLARELQRHRLDRELAYPLTFAGAVGGFLGAKLYYLAEHAGSLSAMDFGGMGFTWFGGMLGGTTGVLLVARRHRISPSFIAGMAAIPLAVGYGIGRLGCLLAGDGTYGRPSDLPWAMSFPEGTVPTTVRVHPTPLYEALTTFAIALLLWRLRDRLRPLALFGVYAVLAGLSRILVELVRVNDQVLAGLTGPQLWSLLLVVIGAAASWRGFRPASAGQRAQPAL